MLDQDLIDSTVIDNRKGLIKRALVITNKFKLTGIL